MFKETRLMIMTLILPATLMASGCTLKKNLQAEQESQAATAEEEVPGIGSSSVPVSDSIVGRVEIGLSEAKVNHLTSTNFKNALTQLTDNLPKTVHPLEATGYDQVPLLIYAACADVSQAMAKSVYKVDFAVAVPAAKSSLIAAGVQMLDQHVAGLASSGPAAAGVSKVFSDLVDKEIAAGDNTKVTFLSVCMAANEYGVAMRGF